MNMRNAILLAMIIGLSATVTSRAADAKENWTKNCAKCHGADGKGATAMGKKLGMKDYTDPKVQAEMKDEVAFKSIKEGLKDASGKVQMKAFVDLSDDEIKALVAYMRAFKK